ncbi:MAG: hypothetical protein HRT73_15150, partial [Flavobacteriales bacterium]|nr:hypothetical protein [Flavobacteriales bacterium]
MVAHSRGKTLGNTHTHAVIYNREDEFYKLDTDLKLRYSKEVDNLLPLNEEHREHYKKVYNKRIDEIKTFFKTQNPDRLFFGKLEDEMVWKKMGDYFNFRVEPNYNSHSNASK